METIFKIVKYIEDYQDGYIFVLSGAGLSAESGIPTFRGSKDGLWNKFNPSDLATFEAFDRDPLTVWKWYLWRMQLISKASPNEAHIALVELEKLLPKFWHITQNVDGLHRLAGQKQFLELHGNIWEGKCRYCGKHYTEDELKQIFPLADRYFLRKLSKEDFEEKILKELDWKDLPRCKVCKGIIGPGVVWFGESLPQKVLEKAFQIAERSSICFSVGTSAVVYPAAYLPKLCKKQGGILIEINPEETALTPIADFSFRVSATKILPKIVKFLKENR